MKHFQEITITIAIEDYGTGTGVDSVTEALMDSPYMDGVELIDCSKPRDKILVDKIE
jgi:hypothetical protein